MMLPSQPLLSRKTNQTKFRCKYCCVLSLLAVIFVVVFYIANTAWFTHHGSLEDKAAASSILIESVPNSITIRYNARDIKEFNLNEPGSEEWNAFHRELLIDAGFDPSTRSTQFRFEMHDDDQLIEDPTAPIVAYRKRKRAAKSPKEPRTKAAKPSKAPRVRKIKEAKPSKASAALPPTTPYPTPRAPENGSPSSMRAYIQMYNCKTK